MHSWTLHQTYSNNRETAKQQCQLQYENRVHILLLQVILCLGIDSHSFDHHHAVHHRKLARSLNTVTLIISPRAIQSHFNFLFDAE